MPTKRTFDLIIISGLLLKPAVGLLRMAARRWTTDDDGALGTIGASVAVAL